MTLNLNVELRYKYYHRDIAKSRLYASNYQSSRAKQLRKELIDAYGGCCTCCGEKEDAFLTLEHINGGGKKHRKQYSSHRRLYSAIKTEGYPKDKYTILCMNCNFASRCGRICPHKKRELI